MRTSAMWTGYVSIAVCLSVYLFVSSVAQNYERIFSEIRRTGRLLTREELIIFCIVRLLVYREHFGLNIPKIH